MREPTPFRLAATLGPAELVAIREEVLGQERFWVGSPVPVLNDKRVSLVLARSPHWINGPGVSTADERSFGTFAFVPELRGLMPKSKALVLWLQKLFGAPDFGSVFASRMESGAVVREHADLGVYYENYHRCQVCLQAEDDTVFTCAGEDLVMKPGEIWVFDNTRPHSVRHRGNHDRVALVVDVAGHSLSSNPEIHPRGNRGGI